MSRAVGSFGEALTANYLRDHGYTILAAGFRCRFGEIDLIAEKKGLLCFVEVKLRSNLAFGLPREYVTAGKQQRIRMTAQYYLSLLGEEREVRFDVAEVYTDGGHDPKGARVHYIEGAFR